MSKNLIRKETRRAYTADVARTPPDSERRTPGTAPIEPKSVSIAAIALPVAIDDSVVDKRKTTEQHTPGQSKSMARSTSKHRGERPRIAHAYHTHIHAYHTHSTRIRTTNSTHNQYALVRDLGVHRTCLCVVWVKYIDLVSLVMRTHALNSFFTAVIQ